VKTSSEIAVPSSHSSEQSGHGLAVATTTVVLLSGVFIAAAALQSLYTTLVARQAVETAMTTTAAPLLLYLAWMGAALGLAGTVLTVFVQGYRPRWFWRCLCIGAVLWSALVPLGTVIGVIVLLLLLTSRRKFPADGSRATPV